jgi:predicted MPP superfamily phosphohydrolase
MSVALLVVVCVPLAAAAYGWLEAGWLRQRVLEVPIDGLPEALDGLRIGHLSDFHLGARCSRGNGASARAVAWVSERRPDLVCVTGDLVSHPRGEKRLRALLAALDHPFVVLGNHDIAVTRDPFSRAAELRDLERAVLLRDAADTVEVRDERVRVVGVDPVAYRAHTSAPHELLEPGTTFALLLCHYPGVVRRLPAGSFDLVLSGHLHAGQISVPLGRHRVTLAHPKARFVAGLYETPAGLMHVSPGTGTTFVPFRFFARPEVTELVLRRSWRRRITHPGQGGSGP